MTLRAPFQEPFFIYSTVMKNVFVPQGYTSKLDVWQTEKAIKFIKDTFQKHLSAQLKLRRITAPLVVECNTGLNDNLSGSESPVSFAVEGLGAGKKVEIVQSLAKWKRYTLWRHQIEAGKGIYTDMNALRPCEELDNIHSIYVDQWDWEKVMAPEERSVEYLHSTVKMIYTALKHTEYLLCEEYPVFEEFLPENITFMHAEELRREYPHLTPKEREYEACRKYGAVFVRGIGCILGDGEKHDTRSSDYDDWSTPTPDGFEGLNGDILIYNPVLDSAFEISSMGIRVSPQALEKQLELCGNQERKQLMFHRLLLDGKLPQTIGGGIGQSRLCMLLMGKCHIGEVQSGVWDQQTREICAAAGVYLL